MPGSDDSLSINSPPREGDVSNTLTGLIPVIYEAMDIVSRELIGAIPAVNRDSNLERAARGQNITIHVAPPSTASDIVPAVTPPNDGDQVFSSFQITIDQAKRVPIRWSGEEQRGLNNGGPGAARLLVDQWAQGFRTMANLIEADVVYKGRVAAHGAYGTAGTTPFGTSGDFTDFSTGHLMLDENGAPFSDRHMVLGSASVNNLRGRHTLLNRVNESGTDRLLRQGILDDIQGFSLHNSAGIKPVVKGTAATVATTAAATVGQTVIPISVGSGSVLPGDIISFAGHTYRYVVSSASASQVVLNSPGLKAPVASGAAVTVGNSFTPNLVFNKQAMVLGTRAPALPRDMSGNESDMAEDRITVVDPVSLIGFEISTYKQYRQIQYEIALAWGAAAVKSDNIMLLLG